jgi:hypothetical protein
VANMEKRRIFNPGKKVVLSPEDVPWMAAKMESYTDKADIAIIVPQSEE